jgi:hypothetical protein
MFLLTVPLLVLDSLQDTDDARAASNLFTVACGEAAAGIALRRVFRGAAWPAALLIAGAPPLILLPSAVTATSFITRYSNPAVWIALYAPGAEVLLAVVLAAALIRRLKSATPESSAARS